MQRHLTRSLISGLAMGTLVLASCGSDSNTADTVVTTEPAAAADSSATAESTPADAALDESATTNAPAAPALISPDGSAEITVTIGTDDFDTSGGRRVVSVPVGTNVSITLTDAAADEEYHLHGYDIEVAAAKGEPGTISFNADQTGQFDLESHGSGATLLVLVVV